MTKGSRKTQTEIIEYEYPDLGPIEVRLQDESAEILRFIRRNDGIEHLERLDQLGGLRAVHKSAHHSKWEHMVLQMYLIQQLKANSTFGTSTSVPLTQQHRVSSLEELLKSWVLLSNCGHLQDTLEAERLWVELVLENAKLYDTFLDCMPDEGARRFATIILRDEDLYRFHYLIALALLRREKEKANKPKMRFDLWIEMLKALLRDRMDSSKPREGSKLARALGIFHTLRRVSYLLLDINRSSLFLRIDSNNLLRNILRKPDVALFDPVSDMNKTLEDVDGLLFSEIYASKEACAFKHQYMTCQKKGFAKLVQKHSISIFCADHSVLAAQLYQRRQQTFGRYQPDPKVKHLCRLSLLPSFPFERTVCRFHSEQNQLRSKVNPSVAFLVTPTSYSESGSLVDVFARGELGANALCDVYRALADYILDHYDEWLYEEQLIGYAASTPLLELFTQILKSVVDSTLTLRFPVGASPREYHVDVITERMNWRGWSISFSKDIATAGLTRSREWELRALHDLLRRERGELSLAAISNLHFYNRDGTRRAEWDGAFVRLARDSIMLCVLEAKRGESKRSQKCSSALLDSLNEVGIRRKQGPFTSIRCKGYAYTKIDLAEVILSSAS